MKYLLLIITIATAFVGCRRPEPNHEAVLMENYGRNGKSDFSIVTGLQWTWVPGRKLYEVPGYETSGDPKIVQVTAKDAGTFTVDPLYQYKAIRGKGIDIIFNYKHLGAGDPEKMLDNIESAILDKLVLNAYREEARNYTTDSLMSNLNAFESQVELRLRKDFEDKFFDLMNLTSGLKPPKSMLQAIEDRNKAIQEAETVKNKLQVSKMELEKAEIDAKTNKVLSEGLTKEILQEKWIEAMRYTNNKVIITDGKTPVILQ